MNDLLKNIVALSSAALEAEDKYIRESLSANFAYPNNRWMSATGNTEIKSIREDFDKLKSHNSKHRFSVHILRQSL